MIKVLLTPEEAADALSLGRTTVYGLMSDGALRSVKIGRARRVPADALTDFVGGLRAVKHSTSEVVAH
jgi:excisionase family DNA binding protein